MAAGSSNFATFLILCPTSFFLGLLFSLFPYDYPILWTATPALTTPDPFTALEQHLSLLHASPPLIPRLLHIVMFTGFLGFLLKLYRASESNLLFDGASLGLYVCAVIVYITNVVKGLRVVSARTYGLAEMVEGEMVVKDRGLMDALAGEELGMAQGGIGREDALRVLSASHAIIALVLMGVLVLQAGQWYAERKEQQEREKVMEDRSGMNVKAAARKESAKKKA